MDLDVAYFKFLDHELEGSHVRFSYARYLPTENPDGSWTPGPWLPAVEGDLELCANGYHYCRLPDLLQWADARLYLVEPGTEFLDGDDKSCSRTIRLLRPVEAWNDQTARLFACDCAEHVLPVIEKVDPQAAEVARRTIEVARRFARGETTRKELDAARAAAGDAARAAAGAAARAAARAAEQQWQLNRLQEYLRGDAT